ncbi:glycoside hydrolase family 18 protein [Melanomma pulvis-pyrius CBS 109.77]|uniref:chitinase n=1 Tax=Melanomma pulvis-pyrius CBS 109.77 TaxID=1314802 RepID=A0A6A6WSJ2_9PLEO|nr:glycoside hydrolase family 18 protein [Melanomma pulvis-pyrius CBS 109.77]
MKARFPLQFYVHHVFLIHSLLLSVKAVPSRPNYIMYLTGQHNIVPNPSEVSSVTHVALAFMRSEIFNQPEPHEWPLFTTVSAARSQFAEGTVIMAAIGGWGNTDGFSKAAKSDKSRALFARNVRAMIEQTGADGVDIDWEYPGGNGEDYKQIPNAQKAWEITAYPKLLSAIRLAIGPSKILSAAVPGLPRDMLAFTSTTIPSIARHVDFLNIMTYDLMNRRDTRTKHHTGLSNSLEAIDTYLERGLPLAKANLGLAFYVKWFRTDPNAKCHHNPIGCKTALMEDPDTGADLGQAGAFSWHDEVPPELATSFKLALAKGVYDDVEGGHYYWDPEEHIWWSWDTPEAIERKIAKVVQTRGLGGVFAWGLGEDAEKWVHLQAASEAIRNLSSDGGGVWGAEERSEL